MTVRGGLYWEITFDSWYTVFSLLLCYKHFQGFPWWSSVKNPPSNGQKTEIPHASGQLSLCAATTEPVHCNKRSLWMPQRRPSAAKNKLINKTIKKLNISDFPFAFIVP